MRQDVIARQVRAMKDAGLDAVLSISPENFAYVTGTNGSGSGVSDVSATAERNCCGVKDVAEGVAALAG